MNVEQRYRLVYKPGLFIVSLVPFAWLLCGALGWFGVSLGADPVKKLELECGTWALNFLLITLLVTPLRNLSSLSGRPGLASLGRLTHLTRLRRMLGLFAFFYAVLHFTVYLTLDLELNFRTLFADIAKRPYITVGFTALLLLIPLAMTSTNAMMRRLGRRWQKLHRLIYVIAVLGVWHFYWQVKRDVREPLVYAGILALLLGYRWARAQRKAAIGASAATPAKTATPTRPTSTSGSATAPERT